MSSRTAIQLTERLPYEERERYLACGGGILSSYQGEDTLTLCLPDDKDHEYVLSGMALVTFYRWCKDDLLSKVYKTRDFIKYIQRSRQEPPSVFVRDAIAAAADTLEKELDASA